LSQEAAVDNIVI